MLVPVPVGAAVGEIRGAAGQVERLAAGVELTDDRAARRRRVEHHDVADLEVGEPGFAVLVDVAGCSAVGRRSRRGLDRDGVGADGRDAPSIGGHPDRAWAAETALAADGPWSAWPAAARSGTTLATSSKAPRPEPTRSATGNRRACVQVTDDGAAAGRGVETTATDLQVRKLRVAVLVEDARARRRRWWSRSAS